MGCIEVGKRRELGRGLDDLIATHDTDLPFLDAYGESDGEAESGLPPSAVGDDPNELLAAFVRFLQSEGAGIKLDGDKASIGEWMEMECTGDGVKISVCSKKQLPLVPSDVHEAGFEAGNLSEDLCNVTVVLTKWGVSSRRFLSRLYESHAL